MKSGGGEQFIATTGVKQKRVASESVTSSDLCFEAAEKLIAELNWEKAEIDALVFVTQSPDYRTPASSCILQDRLGLPQSCFTLDNLVGMFRMGLWFERHCILDAERRNSSRLASGWRYGSENVFV